jgi:hypothetical protein
MKHITEQEVVHSGSVEGTKDDVPVDVVTDIAFEDAGVYLAESPAVPLRGILPQHGLPVFLDEIGIPPKVRNIHEKGISVKD